ncbi:MAG: aminotransferase class V-fold PLP-dependent enzyme [Chlamydiia bacterium]|nr:aminotransferase class V-fold PLP-dependent enzyme [Chlamydiia bacterium]
MFDHHTNPSPCVSALDAMRLSVERKASLEEQKQWEEAIFRLVGAPLDTHFQLTASGAEAIQQVIWSVFLEKARKEGKTHFITSCIEDASLLQMLKRCEELGCTIRIAPVDQQGKIDLAQLQTLITPRTALISLSAAHGLTGVIQPFEEIGRLAKEKGFLFHLDASWGIGKIPISFADLNVDYLSFSGSWIHSMPGTGGVFAKKEVPFLPFILGTLSNLPSLAALSVASRLALLSLDTMGLETARLRNFFEEELLQKIPGLQILFADSDRLPNTTTLLFPKVHHEALAHFLQRRGVLPNQSGVFNQKLHKVLEASGIQTESALSFSFSRMTTEEEVKQGILVIVEVVRMLQKMSEDLF